MGCAVHCLYMLRNIRKTRKNFPQGERGRTSKLSNKTPASLVIPHFEGKFKRS